MFRTEPLDRRERVAGEVRAVMAREKITASALSGLVGIPPASLSRKLNGKVGITVEELLRIGDALGVDASTLLARAGDAA